MQKGSMMSMIAGVGIGAACVGMMSGGHRSRMQGVAKSILKKGDRTSNQYK